MATPAVMPPPPGMGSPGPGQVPPTSAQPASPAPPVPAGPQASNAINVFQITQSARALAKSNPEVAPEIRQINDLVQQIQMKLTQSTGSGEPSAPPIG